MYSKGPYNKALLSPGNLEGGDSVTANTSVKNPTTKPDETQNEAVVGFGSKAEKFLNQIPPDWDLAEKHGKANLAYDLSQCSEPYNANSDNFCHCCQKQIPDQSMFYPLGDNYILGELGEGYPVLFQLMKYLNWLLLLMMLTFFIPVIIVI